MKKHVQERLLLVSIILLFLLVLFGCATKKNIKTDTTEKTEITSDKKEVSNSTTKKDSISSTSITEEAKGKFNIPLTKDANGDIKDVEIENSYGNATVKIGVKDGKLYHDVYIPKTTNSNTSLTDIKSSDTNKESTYISVTDKAYYYVKTVVKGLGKWKLRLIIAALLIFIFKKQVLWGLTKIFPKSAFILKFVGWFASSGSSRIDKLDSRITFIEKNSQYQTNKLEEILIFLQELKPGLIK